MYGWGCFKIFWFSKEKCSSLILTFCARLFFLGFEKICQFSLRSSLCARYNENKKFWSSRREKNVWNTRLEWYTRFFQNLSVHEMSLLSENNSTIVYFSIQLLNSVNFQLQRFYETLDSNINKFQFFPNVIDFLLAKFVDKFYQPVTNANKFFILFPTI